MFANALRKIFIINSKFRAFIVGVRELSRNFHIKIALMREKNKCSNKYSTIRLTSITAL